MVKSKKVKSKKVKLLREKSKSITRKIMYGGVSANEFGIAVSIRNILKKYIDRYISARKLRANIRQQYKKQLLCTSYENANWNEYLSECLCTKKCKRERKRE